jgi:hypothetical protein
METIFYILIVLGAVMFFGSLIQMFWWVRGLRARIQRESDVLHQINFDLLRKDVGAAEAKLDGLKNPKHRADASLLIDIQSIFIY